MPSVRRQRPPDALTTTAPAHGGTRSLLVRLGFTKFHGAKARLLALMFCAAVAVLGCSDASTPTVSFSDIFELEDEVVLVTDPDDPLGGGVDVLPWNGAVAVADELGHNVKLFEPDGRLAMTLGRLGGGPGEFVMPYALAVDDLGRLAVLDPAAAKVAFYLPDGRLAGEFGYSGGGIASLNALDDGRRFLLDVRLVDAESRRPISPHVAHIFDLDGELEASFGRRPTHRVRAESPFMGVRMTLIGDSLAVWGVVGRHTVYVHDLRSTDSETPPDSVRVTGLARPDWNEAPEDDAESSAWAIRHALLARLFSNQDLVIVQFASAGETEGEIRRRYAFVSLDPPRTIAVTEATGARIVRIEDDIAFGITVEMDGEAYLRRYRLDRAALEASAATTEDFSGPLQ